METRFLLLLFTITSFVSAPTFAQQAAMVKDIYPLQQSGVHPTYFASYSRPVGNNLIFFGDNSTHGNELWKSDGTPAGTVMLKDINPGGSFSSIGIQNPSYKFNDLLLFQIAPNLVQQRGLWRTDGTEAGTFKIADGTFEMQSRESDSALYLRNNFGLIKKDPSSMNQETIIDAKSHPDFARGLYLFKSAMAKINGKWIYSSLANIYITNEKTKATTYLVKTTNRVSSFVFSSGSIFFAFSDGVNGQELWKTDGTPEGTKMVKNIAPAGVSSSPNNMMPVKGGVIFLASDGVTGMELWFSDGTDAGTKLIKDFNTGNNQIFDYNVQFVQSELDESVYFRRLASELWKTDGTSEGTVMISDGGKKSSFWYNSYDNIPLVLKQVDGSLYFLLLDQSRRAEIWKSDGKPNGSLKLGDLPNLVMYPNFHIANKTLFYAGEDGTHGTELWSFSLCSHSARIETPAGASFCPGSSVTITAEGSGSSAAYTYQWKEGNNLAGTNASLTVTKPGIYAVGVTSNGCTVTASVEITEAKNLPVTITGNTLVCQGQSSLLTAKATGGIAPYNFQWKLNGANAGKNSDTLSATVAGNYAAVVTDTKGCTGTSNILSINTKPSPVVTVSSSGAMEFLSGASITLSVPFASGQTYQWTKDNAAIAGATNNSLLVKDQGTYVVMVSRDGCTASSQPSVVSLILGTEPVSKDGYQLAVFPNPAIDGAKATFTSPKPVKVEICVYDVHGRKLSETTSQANLKNHEAFLDLSQLAAGTYLVKAKVQETGKELVYRIFRK